MARILLYITLLLLSDLSISQNTSADNVKMPSDLELGVERNNELLKTNPEAAISQMDSLIIESIKQDNKTAELNLLRHRFIYYYYSQVNFEKMIESAKVLKEKARDYNNPYYQADANLFLFDSYCLNKLYDKALNELMEGIKTLNDIHPETDNLYNSKANFYIAYANYYSTQGNTLKEIENLHTASKEREKIKDEKRKTEIQFKDYANLSDAYSRMQKMDSAKLFALKSIKLSTIKDQKSQSMYTNYLVLGQVYQYEGKYQDAIEYYTKAEGISQQNHFLNIERLYEKSAELYHILGDEQKKKEYEYKIKDLKLSVSEKKNQSLHKIIEETKENDNSQAYLYLIIGSVAVIFFLSFLVLYFRKKNKILEQQEKVSQEYLLEHADQEANSYQDLIEMVKNNEVAFMVEFHKAFPDFTKKLQRVNHTIVQSEVEFCAFLKLKLSTKDIARYKNIEPKTVQNKKYRIRKKLNIPENVDIYLWFDQY